MIGGRVVKEVKEIGRADHTVLVIAVKSNKVQANGRSGADFIEVNVWGKLAETCIKYLKKGDTVLVTGRIRKGEYIGRDGSRVYVQDVVANEIEFIWSSNSRKEETEKKEEETTNEYMEVAVEDEDLPF